MTKEEKRIVMGVFFSIMRQKYGLQNSILGSATIEEMNALYQRLKYEDFCQSRGIRYEDMTEDDFIEAYLEENEE